MTGASWLPKERRTREGEYFEHDSRAPVRPNATNAWITDLRSVPNTTLEWQLTVDADRPYRQHSPNYWVCRLPSIPQSRSNKIWSALCSRRSDVTAYMSIVRM